MYYVLNFSVNEENIQFPSGSGNRFQIKLDSNTEIEELNAIDDFPKIFFKFISLEKIQNINKNEKIGIVFNINTDLIFNFIYIRCHWCVSKRFWFGQKL